MKAPGPDLRTELEALRRENARLQKLLERLEDQRLGEADRIQLDALFASLPYLFFLMGADDTHLAFRAGRLSVPFVPPEQFLGRRLDQVLPEPAASIILKTMRRVRETQQSAEVEYPLPFADGHRWYQASFVPLPEGRIGIVASDVTERKQREDALRESKERFEAIAQAMPISVVITREEDGRVLYGNSVLAETFEVPLEALTDQVAPDFYVRPEERDQVIETMRRTGSVSDRELQMRTTSGRQFWASFSARRVRFDGQAALLAGIIDITERMRLQEQLQRSQKLESIGRLAGGIAHDFNNLLTAILGYTQILESRFEADATTVEDLGEIRRAGLRARDLTQQLLTVAKRRLNTPRIMDLNQLVTEMERLLRRVVNEDIELVSQLAPGLWPIKADPTQIEQVLMNLAVNAGDAMPEGGRLTIETANRHASGGDAAALDRGEAVVLRVSDTGHGMSAEVLTHVFEPFFTTKPVGQGTGLGLATVYGTVHQSGGHIDVDSAPGKGTVFTVCFPRATEAVEPALVEPGLVASGGAETVLVVEDNPAVRTLAVRVLSKAGYTVRTAGTGAEALELMNAETRPIDLLITDVVMPQMSGKEMSNRLSLLRPGMRVLYVSGYPQSTVDHHGVLQATDEFLPKPFTGPQLLAKVRHLLDRAPRA